MSDAIEVVRHPQARRAKLSVDPRTGQARLTLPPRAALKSALAWAEKHRDWIAGQQARLPRPRPFTDGAALPFGDEELAITWDPAAPRRVTRDGGRLVCGGPAEALPRRIEAWLKREASAVLTAETRAIAALAGVEVTQVAVGDPRGRWGSCASTGAIRYSWRLISAPVFVRRATVAHEVAHRVHMNHGPAFHALAAALNGADPAPARAWLREHGAALHWLGREA